MLKISLATSEQISIVKELFLEYAKSLDFDLGFQGFTSEVDSLPGLYASPRGCILLAFVGAVPAGCVAMRPIENGICEMKRLYVKQTFQGQGIGRELTRRLLERASSAGYKKIRLDTVPSMIPAMKMYRSMGFYSIPAYCDNPVRGATYLEKVLEHPQSD